MAGVGKPSEASEGFLCEKWTMPEPGKSTVSVHFKVGSFRRDYFLLQSECLNGKRLCTCEIAEGASEGGFNSLI